MLQIQRIITMSNGNLNFELPEQFSNRVWLQRLLNVEKKRRSVSPSSLIFVGMHNISQYWWCGMYSIIKSRHNEVELFEAYLKDRVAYSLLSGRIIRIPQKQQDLLEVGSDLLLKDIEQLSLKKGLPDNNKLARQVKKIGKFDTLFRVECGDALEQGLRTEFTMAEFYPSYRWNFPYSKYVIIGKPDGITKKFVYEFKSTSRKFFARYQKCVAQTQADFYGYFFKRKSKRVQIFTEEDGTTETFELPVDLNRVKETMAKFEAVDSGSLPHPPAKWKCKNCEFKNECDICQV